MSIFLFSILEALAFATVTTIRGAVKNRGEADKNSWCFIMVALSSVWWTICFGTILVCDDFHVAYILRTVGMIGTFAYLITGTVLIASWTELSGKWKKTVIGFALTGVLVYPLSVQKDLIIFHKAGIGTTYTFLSSIETNIYTAYSVIIAVLMYIMIIWMIRSTDKRRKKVMGKRVLAGVVVVSLGMLFDTILPMFGLPALPTSTVGQAICVLLMYRALAYDKKNQIDIANIASYIDRSTEVYVLVYDENLDVRLASQSASDFFKIKPNRKYKIYELFSLEKEVFKLQDESIKLDATCIVNEVECNLGIEKIQDEFGDLIGYAVSVIDVTEKIEYIREIEEARKKADMANEAKSSFLAQMSHEIRTPMNAVLGMDEMIMRSTDVSEIYKYAENIQSAGKSLLNIIDDILDFSKIESGKMSIVESNYSVKQAVRALYSVVQFRAKKKGLELRFEIDENMPCELYGDELRIRQIFLNLINNAIKYTEVGWVKVKITKENVDDNNIKLMATVEDTGIGIKKEDMPKLFKRFQRLDEKINHNVEGTGLGLSIVYNLVSMMNGEVDVKSVYQRGSVFSVCIPQRIMNNKQVGHFDIEYEGKAKEYHETFKAPDARILVVDDNRINLTIVKGLLKATEVQIDTAVSGFECLELVKNNRYQVIFLDHMMPEMDGIEVLRRLKKMEGNMSKDAVVIALTANAMSGVRETYINHGFDDYMAKPIDPKELEDTLRRYIV